MEILKSILFSFIQSITEFLPISSSGHLLFFKNILNFEEYGIFYDIILHTGSLAAIIFFFFEDLKKLMVGFFDELKEINFNKNKNEIEQNKKITIFEKTNIKIILFSFISTFTTLIIFILFKKTFDLILENPKILPFTFLFTSILILTSFVVTKKFEKSENNKQNLKDKKYFFPLIVGIIQGISILPGVSRSGSTISIGLILKTEKNDSFFYSFLLSIFAIAGSFLFSILEIKGLDLLIKSPLVYISGFIFSFIFSFFTLKLLKILIKKNLFFYFSIYTFILSLLSFFTFY